MFKIFWLFNYNILMRKVLIFNTFLNNFKTLFLLRKKFAEKIKLFFNNN